MIAACALILAVTVGAPLLAAMVRVHDEQVGRWDR